MGIWIKHRVSTVIILLIVSGMISCGGGGGGASSTSAPATGSSITLISPNDPLPSGVKAFAKISDDVTKLYFVSNSISGQAVLWEEGVSGGVPLPSSILRASSFSQVNGWINEAEVKASLPSSVIDFGIDGLGDLHVSWFTPGVGIFARSRIGGVWGGETLLTQNGGCLDMETQPVIGGASMTWCESGPLIGYGERVLTSWQNRGVLKELNGDTIAGSEPSFDVTDSGITVAWNSNELGSDGVTQVNALRVAGFDPSLALTSNEIVAVTDVSVTPKTYLFDGGTNRRLLVWVDSSNSTIQLFASVFTGTWSPPVLVASAPDGYTDIQAYFLTTGGIILGTHRLGRELAVFMFNGLSWSNLLTLPNVVTFTGTEVGNEYVFAYSSATETKGIKISNTLSISDLFTISVPVNDLGIGQITNKELMVVWRDAFTAYYAQIEL